MSTVVFDLEVQEDPTPVEGNASASGDDDIDKKCEDAIIVDLEGGNVWAWAAVQMTARINGIECSDYLGCCSYKDGADFRKDASYLDMKAEALSSLHAKCYSMLKAVEDAEADLAADREAYNDRQEETELWRCPYCKDVVAVDPGYDDIPFCADCATQRFRFDPVDVVFLKDTDDGDVLAVFPGEASTVGNPDLMTCYTHIGQHGSAGTAYYEICKEVTDPAKYADLANELDRIGYNIHVVRKDCISDPKYADARLEQLRS